jgi:hypothetical protein
MSVKTALLLSDDPLSKLFADTLFRRIPHENIYLILVKSPNLRRVLRMLWKGKVPFLWILNEYIASIYLKFKYRRLTWPRETITVSTSAELNDALDSLKIETCLAFRCGLIIPKKTLQKFGMYNIHCASIPTYAGLASIWRALSEGAYQQEATCHQMVPEVDAGKILLVRPYVLDPKVSYLRNSLRAYESGIELGPEALKLIWSRP